MAGSNPAPGGPGIPPRWTRGAKDAVGTAYAVSSRVWYTLANGVITEVYYPTIDTPQIRDIQYLVTDGETFFHDERRHMQTQIDCVQTAALGFKVTNSDPEGRYTIEKQIIGDPHSSCLLVHTRFNVAAGVAGQAASLCDLRSPSADRRHAQQRRGRGSPRTPLSGGLSRRCHIAICGNRSVLPPVRAAMSE